MAIFIFICIAIFVLGRMTVIFITKGLCKKLKLSLERISQFNMDNLNK